MLSFFGSSSSRTETPSESAEPARATAVVISPQLQASLDEYEILRELGRGADSEVYMAREKATGREVACKIIRKASKRPDQLKVSTLSFFFIENYKGGFFKR
jgi:serine/threonine protein kinase